MFNPKDHLINLAKRGAPERLYLPVAARIAWFREDHPDYGISTEFERIDFENEIAVARAIIRDTKNRILAVGTKVETLSGFDDYVEKAETGAVGRALGILGYGTQFEPAFEEGTDRIADAHRNGRDQSAERAPGGAMIYRCSGEGCVKQISFNQWKLSSEEVGSGMCIPCEEKRRRELPGDHFKKFTPPPAEDTIGISEEVRAELIASENTPSEAEAPTEAGGAKESAPAIDPAPRSLLKPPVLSPFEERTKAYALLNLTLQRDCDIPTDAGDNERIALFRFLVKRKPAQGEITSGGDLTIAEIKALIETVSKRAGNIKQWLGENFKDRELSSELRSTIPEPGAYPELDPNDPPDPFGEDTPGTGRLIP